MAVNSGNRLPWVLGAVVLAVFAAVLFSQRRPAAPAPAPAGSAPVSAAPAPLSASQVERGIGNAKAAVEADPKDAAAWAMLAHSYEMIGRFDEAAGAYRALLALRPQDAQAHADFADALGVANKGSLQGEPAKLIGRALELDPANVKALVLGGKAAFERQRYSEAIALWERALQAGPEGAMRQPLQTSIAEARALMAPASAGGAASAATGAAFVAGRITVSAAMKDRVGPDDTVFVFARPASGSRMPVALLRKRGRDLPLDFALDDTLAMVPTARLSQQAQVIVGVRVSRRGDAIPAAGDLEAELGPVKPGATGLKLEIDHARP